MKKQAEAPVATASDYNIPIEELGDMLRTLDEEPPRPRVLRVSDELMRMVTETEEQ